MTNPTTTSPMTLVPSLEAAWRDVDSSFGRFCLTAGIGAIKQVLCEDAQRLAGPRHSRGERVGHRWGATKGKKTLSRIIPRCCDLMTSRPREKVSSRPSEKK